MARVQPWRALLVACAFATRIPVRTGEIRPGELPAAISCLPLVGFALGGVSALLFALLGSALGPHTIAVLALALMAAITGGLHLDGLADLFDALGGGRGERTRMLEIMRDSRIGAHGAAALVFLLLGKVSVLGELAGERLQLGLWLAPAAGRLMAVWLLQRLPAARSDGLGHAMGLGLTRQHALLASGLFAFGAVWFGVLAVLPTLACVAVAWWLGWLAQTRLGGITGDVCGAAIELSELVFLLAVRAGAS